MNPATLRIQRLRPDAQVPRYATEGSAGLDLRAAIDAPLALEPGQFAKISTGLAIALPPSHEGQVRPRSGLAARFGITILNAPGTIDEDYRGEVAVLLVNHGPSRYVIKPGMRIAQLVIAPIRRVDVVEVTANELGETMRGDGGFGSTGV